jgi:hypothetical protein
MSSSLSQPTNSLLFFRSGPILWAVAGILAAAAVAVALYKTWPSMHPDVLARAPLNPSCDLREGPCRVRFPDGGEIALAISPRDIPVVQPLQIAVDLKSINARKVAVDFAGLDMDMGYNRVALQEVRPGRYEGKAMLPVCVRRRMRWEAKVLVQSPAGYLVGPFRFDTVRP